jgi:hypothetical protein
MTIIANSKGFIFVHLHKCGGSSVEQSYQPHSKWNDLILGSTPEGEQLQHIYRKLHGLHKHSPALAIREVVGSETWDRYWTVALVRHPKSIFESFYRMLSRLSQHYMKSTGIDRKTFAADVESGRATAPFTRWGMTKAYARSGSFPEFMEILFGESPRSMTLTRKISDRQNNFLVQSVFKLENIDQFWAEFSDKIGANVERRHTNRGSAVPIEWDRRHLDEIARRFEVDLKNFSYEL